MQVEKRVRKPRQARSRATVDAILEGAAQVLRTDGLEGLTTAKVAKRAGVSVGSMYQYFRDKGALLDAVADRHLHTLLAHRSRVLLRELDSEDIAVVIPTLIDDLLALHSFDPLLMRELRRHDDATGQCRLALYLADVRGLVAEQPRTPAHLARPLDPELAARVLVDSVCGLVEPLAREEPELLEQPVFRQEVAALVAGYLSPANPLAA